MAEQRLIDANALRRDLIDNWAFYSVLMKNALDRQPTIDAVPVVRCKDCKHYKHYGRTSIGNIKCGWCNRRIRYDEEYRMLPDDFCSYGERGEGK